MTPAHDLADFLARAFAAAERAGPDDNRTLAELLAAEEGQEPEVEDMPRPGRWSQPAAYARGPLHGPAVGPWTYARQEQADRLIARVRPGSTLDRLLRRAQAVGMDRGEVMATLAGGAEFVSR